MHLLETILYNVSFTLNPLAALKKVVFVSPNLKPFNLTAHHIQIHHD